MQSHYSTRCQHAYMLSCFVKNESINLFVGMHILLINVTWRWFFKSAFFTCIHMQNDNMWVCFGKISIFYCMHACACVCMSVFAYVRLFSIFWTTGQTQNQTCKFVKNHRLVQQSIVFPPRQVQVAVHHRYFCGTSEIHWRGAITTESPPPKLGSMLL